MKMIWQVFLIACFIFAIMPQGEATQPSAISPLIKVGLWQNQRNIAIASDGGFVLTDEKNHALGEFKDGEKIFFSLNGKTLSAGGKNIAAKEFTIAPRTKGGTVAVNNKFYRGKILLKWDEAKGIQAINELELEEYLWSIVPSEMPPAWHFEALKAQAVAARSFALARLGAHQKEGFDVCASSHCQVYNGISSEAERATAAVQNTAGIALLYDGEPITAAFHSSSGGFTENAADAWGSDIFYLRSVKDFDADTPNYKWEKKLSPESAGKRLSGSGYNIGNLQAVELSALDYGAENTASDRTRTGRVKSMRFIGDTGSVTVSGDRVRDIFGLKSTFFDVLLEVPAVSSIDVEVGSLYTKKIEVDLPAYQETRGWPTDKKEIRRLTGREGETIVFSGYGFGHGIGMSQWGAKQMAEKVPETNTTYYGEILKHYYTGVQLKKLY
jgi:stage II sporulation protein D